MLDDQVEGGNDDSNELRDNSAFPRSAGTKATVATQLNLFCKTVIKAPASGCDSQRQHEQEEALRKSNEASKNAARDGVPSA